MQIKGRLKRGYEPAKMGLCGGEQWNLPSDQPQRGRGGDNVPCSDDGSLCEMVSNSQEGTAYQQGE